MNQITFNQINDESWRETAVQSLKGIPYKKLQTHTLEGITIDPLYTKEMYDVYFSRDVDSFTRQIQTGINTPDWTIAQVTYAKTGETFIQELKKSLDAGNEAIVYDGREPVNWDEQSLSELAQLLITHPVYAFHVEETDKFMQAFHMISSANRHKVIGVLQSSAFLEGFDQLRSLIDSVPFHMDGADSVMELALALSSIVKKSEDLPDFSSLAKNIAVRFAVDTQFFMEIAKLRAFRVLWQTLCRAYNKDIIHIPVIAETSLRTFTRFDSHMNMIRGGNEALAAVIGGVDVFTVHPHLGLEEVTEASIRTARNIQLIIREESFLKYVIDPASGSYYIDILTKELIDAAWTLFQEIENNGGYEAYQDSGKMDAMFKRQSNHRLEKMNLQKSTLVGTNRYVDVNEIRKTEEEREIKGRIAQPFEQLRMKGLQMAPRVVLLRIGSLQDYKARADFAKGLLAVGGIDAVESPVFATTEEVAAWISSNKYTYYVFCTSYENIKASLENTPKLKANWNDAAGSFSEEEQDVLKKIGIDDFIYAGMNQLEKLEAIITTCGEEGYHEKA